MSIRLPNAPDDFMILNRVLTPFLDSFMIVFLNDSFVYSKSEEEHVDHLCTVLGVLANQRLYDKFYKCEFCVNFI